MIEFSRSYKASDGKCYATLGEAQAVEITRLFPQMSRELANEIVDHSDEVLMVLTLTDSSRPKARGAKKPRKPKANADLPSYQETRREDGVTP